MFVLLAERVFTLQIIKGADYQKNFIMLIKKPLSIEASRGNIYDVMVSCLLTISLHTL